MEHSEEVEMTVSALQDAHEPLGRKYRSVVHQTALWYPSGVARKHMSAELVGSVLLQFLRGCAVVNSMDVTLNGSDYAAHHGQSGLLISALGAGTAYAALLAATAGERGSGGKLNPAISTALFISRRMDPRTFVAELMMQLSGALIGALLVWIAIPAEFMYYSGDPALFHLEGAVTWPDILRGMFTEFMLTAMLVIVYIATAEDFHNRVYTKTLWPVAVGLATTAGMLGGTNSGGAMNPASGIAAAVVYWDINNLAAYLLATTSGAVFGALVYLKLLGNDLNDAPLRPQSVFEGVRQETKEFGQQNFIMYVVVDFVHDRLSSDPFETRFSGRICYPQMHNAVSQVEGMVTNDGKVLRVTELGGTFKGAQIQGYMPDTGHMVGLQVHENGGKLAYVAVTLVGPKMAQRIISQIDSLREPPPRDPTPPPSPKRPSLQLC
eukprot:Tamp_07335.p1 GENE.Tamp_07335~~Tamp_07335.p1  ORF type:complete len:437 (+),score=99.44 Tamp_07335:59-1369(+)